MPVSKLKSIKTSTYNVISLAKDHEILKRGLKNLYKKKKFIGGHEAYRKAENCETTRHDPPIFKGRKAYWEVQWSSVY